MPEAALHRNVKRLASGRHYPGDMLRKVGRYTVPQLDKTYGFIVLD